MSVQVGLVGKPNVGKSTLFSALTLKPAEAADYPFTTVEPNKGVGHVRTECPCREFGVECDPRNSMCIEGNRFVPVEIMDVAGLVPGAHEGRGLGNKFLDDLRRADVLVMVVDASGSTDEEGKPVEPGSHDPLEDVRFLERELDMWIKGILEKDWERTVRRASLEGLTVYEALEDRLSGIGVSRDDVEKALEVLDLPEDLSSWSEEHLEAFAREVRKASKPMVIAANKIDVEGAEENVERLKEELDYPVIPVCAEAELALRRAAEDGLVRYVPGDPDFEVLDESRLTDEQKRALEFIRGIMEEWGGTGAQDVVNEAVFGAAARIVVYPVENENKLCDSEGRILPDAILLEKGSTARDLAYKIHSEIGDSFVRAIVIRPDGSKDVVGEDYVLSHGDVVKIQTA